MTQAGETVNQVADSLTLRVDSLLSPLVERSLTLTDFSTRDLCFCLVAFCVLLSSYVLSLNKKMLWQRICLLFQRGSKSSSYNSQSMAKRQSPSFRPSIGRNSSLSSGVTDYLVLLLLQCGILMGLSAVYCTSLVHMDEPVTAEAILMILAGCVVFDLYMVLKIGIYRGLGWLFLEHEQTRTAVSAYCTLVYVFSILLLPFLLVCLYYPVSVSGTMIGMLCLLGVFKILAFLMWLKLFCSNIYGGLLILLYFCALELIPLVLLWKAMSDLMIF